MNSLIGFGKLIERHQINLVRAPELGNFFKGFGPVTRHFNSVNLALIAGTNSVALTGHPSWIAECSASTCWGNHRGRGFLNNEGVETRGLAFLELVEAAARSATHHLEQMGKLHHALTRFCFVAPNIGHKVFAEGGLVFVTIEISVDLCFKPFRI